MSYQALLFCADEKLARVVTQVFTELEFNVEPVNEPFAAVKKLMAQHYDAIVVDCDNEQNAALMFKSARNSSTNQNSLALALVEGQAGVAKAYRIGANLVLTKPINVEQAKGTLRVARGLLRKNADLTGSAPSVQPAIVPPTPKMETPGFPSPATPKPEAPPTAASSLGRGTPSFTPPPQPPMAIPRPEPVLPAMAASTKVATPATTSTPTAETTAIPETPIPLENAPVPPPTPATAPVATKPAAAFGTFQSAAAAPAPAKEVVAPTPAKTAETELFETSPADAQPAEVVAAPTFSGLEDQSSDGGSSKKILFVAAVVVIAAGLGYFGWTRFAAKPVQQQVAMPQPTAQAPVPQPVAPVSGATVATTPVTSAPAAENSGKPHPGATSPAATTKIAVGSSDAPKPEVVTKTFSPAPIQVKNESSAPKPQVQAEDSSAPMPSPLGVGSNSSANLASLVSRPTSIPVAPARSVKISQGVSQGLLIKKVQPAYPLNARTMRIEGAVEMQAVIDKEGKITNLKVIKGQSVLVQAAVDAVRQWRYKPYYLDGQPVEIQTDISVVFKLPN